VIPYTPNLDQLLESIPRALDDGLIPARIFNDPDVYRAELERLFTRCWVFLGHVSEIASPGDYVLRYIGEDPFILVRDEYGTVRVLFDACRHRGTQLCRAEKGNTSHFRCPYHGWTYRNTGEFISAPAFRAAYGGLDKTQWGLLPAPHVELLHGLVFASLDPEAPPLEAYLGDMAWYLDMLFGLDPDSLEVVGEPHRWVIDANWKTGAENFAGDDYHTVFLHKSMWDVGAIQIPAFENLKGYHIHAHPGHSLSLSMAPNEDDPGPKFWGFDDDVVAHFDPSRMKPEQFRLARRSRVAVGTVFPNFSFLFVPQSADPKVSPPTGMMCLRVWQPRGPRRMELWNWVLSWKHLSPERRHHMYRTVMGTFSPSGIFEQDDTEPWQSIARIAGSAFARTRDLRLHYGMGLPGIGSARVVEDFPGPGTVFWPRYEEGVQRNFYRGWFQAMTNGGDG